MTLLPEKEKWSEANLPMPDCCKHLEQIRVLREALELAEDLLDGATLQEEREQIRAALKMSEPE